MTKLSPIITDIVHTAMKAALTDDEQIQRQGLADIYDAIASVLHVDHRASPVDLAKKLGRTAAVSAADPSSASRRDGGGTEEPAVSGCPSLGPKVFPSGADGTEPAESDKNPFYEFYGLKLNRFGGAGLNAKLIGKRVKVDKSVQVFEIEVKRSSLATGARAFVTENGELIFSIVGGKSFAAVENMAISALHAMLKRRCDNNKRKNLRRARKAAAKRAAAQALIDKELA